jgi:hypothetical protein
MLVEKNYWIMHGLWGLQAQGFVFELKGGRNQDKPTHISSRLAYYDELAKRISIPSIDSVERDAC